jgi:putative ABC transport system ATP-binding protein
MAHASTSPPRPDSSAPAPLAPVREPIVVTEQLIKKHRLGETEILGLRGIDLKIYPSEFVVILGPSGSGKTTLLNIIGGLDQPSGGKITVAGRDLANVDENVLTAFRRDVVGFIFQFYNLIPTLTARENVELIGELTKEPLDAVEMLNLVGLSHRMDSFPVTLSGGESQRVAIARALIKRPALLLADEPTGALDFDTSIRVLKVLRDAMKAVEFSVILVTHNEEIAKMADRVIRIASGQIASDIHVPEPLSPEELHW